MGELEPWVDENFIRSLWFGMGEQVNVKMIRDKFTGSNAGYCFVDFQTAEAAAKALNLNGQMIPNSSRPFKLNWATGGGLADRRYVKKGFKVLICRIDPNAFPGQFELITLLKKKKKKNGEYWKTLTHTVAMTADPSIRSSSATLAQRSMSSLSCRSSRTSILPASLPKS